MHKRLENYLAEVAARLHSLPTARRNEELREIRAHLENAVQAYQELGDSEDDAAQAAVQRFGSANTIGRQMARTWWRGRFIAFRESVSGLIVMAAILLALPNMLLHALIPAPLISPGVGIVPTGHLAFTAAWAIVIGGYFGWKMPQRTRGSTTGAVFAVVALASVLRQTPYLIASRFFLECREMNEAFLLEALFWALLATPAALASRALAKRRAFW